jgi:hypothetical protein
MKFHVREHSTKPGIQCVDVMTDEGMLIGMIYPQAPNVLSVMSKFGVNAIINPDSDNPQPIPEAIVTIGELKKI